MPFHAPPPRFPRPQPQTHLKDPEQPTRGMCGAGYPWPSSVLLTLDADHVTCRNCRDIITYRMPTIKTWDTIRKAYDKGEIDPSHPGGIVPTPPGMTMAQWDEAVRRYLTRRAENIELLAPWEDATWD